MKFEFCVLKLQNEILIIEFRCYITYKVSKD